MKTYESITAYLDTLPGVLALWWFMENVHEEHEHRSELFFYCRERVCRYRHDPTRKDQTLAFEVELAFDADMFELQP